MKILNCRRSLVAIFAISCLTLLGMYHGTDISGIAVAIAGIAGSLAGSNAWENRAMHQSGGSKPVPGAAKQPVDSPD